MKPAAWFFLSVRALLGIVFIVSGFQKLTSPAANFAADIEKFELLHGPLVLLTAQILPWLEFVAGVLFILGLWTTISGLLLWALNTGFVLLLSSSLIRKLPIEQCGCFGEAIHLSVPQMLALDCTFWVLFLVFFAFHGPEKAPSLDKQLHG